MSTSVCSRTSQVGCNRSTSWREDDSLSMSFDWLDTAAVGGENRDRCSEKIGWVTLPYLAPHATYEVRVRMDVGVSAHIMSDRATIKSSIKGNIQAKDILE